MIRTRSLNEIQVDHTCDHLPGTAAVYGACSMTRIAGKSLIIEPEPPGKCAFCGQIAELRPYGPMAEQICFECSQLDDKATVRQYKKRLDKTIQTVLAVQPDAIKKALRRKE